MLMYISPLGTGYNTTSTLDESNIQVVNKNMLLECLFPIAFGISTHMQKTKRYLGEKCLLVSVQFRSYFLNTKKEKEIKDKVCIKIACQSKCYYNTHCREW